jgi:carboxylesterase type B
LPLLPGEPPKIKGLDPDIFQFGKSLIGGENATWEGDCLFLNVWSKPSGDKKKAVMIWIYGAFHVSDVPIVLATAERKVGKKNSEEQNLLIHNVQTAWAAFARDPEKGLTELGWPKYDPKKSTLIRLRYQNKGATSYSSASSFGKNGAWYVIPHSAPK